MKKIALITVCIFLLQGMAEGQIDSIRRIIEKMGYDLPRLSPAPVPLTEKEVAVVSLNGTWKFSEDAQQDSPSREIEVPGEWVMQGFKVKPGTYTGYQRNFLISPDWKDKRIKLRCDAVFSECDIYINDRKAGHHLGGFTPFETDISAFVIHGKENRITIRVRSESLADSLSSASKYAVHPLGGISRKIYLMAIPEINCSMFHVSTVFDKNYKNALLKAGVELANESSREVRPDLRFELLRMEGPTIFQQDVKWAETLQSGSLSLKDFSFDVEHPDKWDPEHPNLYMLRLSILNHGKVVETVSRIFGFKQTEVRGNQVFVNNMPIKLRGVCRHEVMPLRGRSLSPLQWEEDVKLFRAANINYIRTSHYPPAPELIEACDRLGMFVEVEGPFCWADQTRVPENMRYQALIQPELEMVNAFRSDPSVLMWSIANESEKYKEYFSQPASLIKAMDPTRPRNFSQFEPGGDSGELEIGNHHYPGPTGPEKYADSRRPITFDEYCHLNAYNRFELVTDPGIRDAWGIGFERMWEKMYCSKGVLGGSLWAAIDDSFVLPDGSTVGYGTWGPVDGWRRPKPEYWHVKKVYSPVKIRQGGNRDAIRGTIQLEIENRMLFSDLSECRFNWKAGEQSGSFAVSAKPGESVQASVKVPLAGSIQVEVTDPRGVVIDQYEFNAIPVLKGQAETRVEKIARTENNAEILIRSGNITLVIDKINNCLKEIRTERGAVITGEALLMILPLNSEGNGTQMLGDGAKFDPFTATSKNRVVLKLEQTLTDQEFILTIYDRSDEAMGYTEYHLAGDKLIVGYGYEVRKNINPRQVGLVFGLPGKFRQLDWERNGQWNFYPQDQIGRLKGTAMAVNNNPFTGPAGPAAQPALAWAFDQNEMGTNDFRSTKMSITNASLTDGLEKVTITSDGSQSIRCWLDQGKTNMLVAEYSNMGAEGFFRSHAALADHPLKPGDKITGMVILTFPK
jgi:beta-galactosidase